MLKLVKASKKRVANAFFIIIGVCLKLSYKDRDYCGFTVNKEDFKAQKKERQLSLPLFLLNT